MFNSHWTNPLVQRISSFMLVDEDLVLSYFLTSFALYVFIIVLKDAPRLKVEPLFSYFFFIVKSII